MKISRGAKLTLAFVVLFAIAGAFLIRQSIISPGDFTLSGKKKIRLQLQWFDQAQFAGFYVAEAKNYYLNEGLNVEIIPGGYNVNPIQRVVQGDADVGLSTGDQVLISYTNGRNLKAIGTVFNTSLACFMSKKETKIKSPQDLIGKKVGAYRGFDTENILLSILSKHHIPAESVEIRDAGSIESFLRGELDVFPSYIINEPIVMKEKDIAINLMYPSDFGVQFYSDTIFTTEEYYEKNKVLLEKFLKASAKGWAEAERDPKGALDIIANRLGSGGVGQHTLAYHAKQLEEALKHIRAGHKNQVFYMERSIWDSMENSLVGIGKCKRSGNIEKLCDFEIIEKALQ